MKTSLFVAAIRLVSAMGVGASTLLFAPLTNAADCQFNFGFALLHSTAPEVVGECVTNEVYDAQGSTQQSSNGQLIWHRADNWTAFTNGYEVWVNTPDGLESRLVTQRFSWEPNPQGLPLVAGSDGQSATTYFDDRSNEYALMESWANALNRREYARAYSYWEPNSTQLSAFEQFQIGYANMASVRLSLGAISEDAAAGNRFASVPVVLTTQTITDGVQVFAGCYTLHTAVPAIQDTPPFAGWAIQSAMVWQVTNDANTASLLTTACPSAGGSILSALPLTDPTDVSTTRYLDDRSNAPELVRSLINALNRGEFLRAYSYWEPTSAQLQDYAAFKNGYATTKSVDLQLGVVTSDAGAGQRYFKVPALMLAHLNDGTTQNYAGCYTLHLSDPAIQGVPPFQPLAVQTATVQAVGANAGLPNCSGT